MKDGIHPPGGSCYIENHPPRGGCHVCQSDIHPLRGGCHDILHILKVWRAGGTPPAWAKFVELST